ncbi:MAG TPA: c-type cytochrome [Thermoanaerobaculia bacterium]
MRRFIVLLLVSLVAGAGAQQPCGNGPGIPLPPVCGQAVAGPRVACGMPRDVDSVSANGNVAQRQFDVFSWQEMIALNWPALPGERGEPDRTKPIGAPGPRVWETWKETSEVYLPDGRRPPAWNEWPAHGRIKRLFRDEKVDDVLDDDIQPTGADGTLPITLTDRNRNVVRYEIRMNRVLFDYVVARKLYNSGEQAKAVAIDVPDGSMLIKAAWREIDGAETQRYITTEAEVCDGQMRSCVRRTVGLAGLHIMHKTKNAPQWVWSTFEQRDNVEGDQPSFFDPACHGCEINRQTFPGVRNQVVRTTPIPSQEPVCSAPTFVDDIADLNRRVGAALAERRTPLASYQLVSTQWPTSSGTPATVFTVQPPVLANTTMETFIQPTSSCMGCHAMARTVRRENFVAADFTFTLNNAGPAVRPLPQFTPAHPDSWGVRRARAITLNTYEMVPPPHVVARLHCGSCHLDAGTNVRAAWWVGSSDRYSPRTKLFDRINQCFTNSMNGKAICDGDAACERNADMMALVEYIDDLTRKWNGEHPATPAPCAFPAIPTLSGDAASGKEIFLQKCAFCHGAEGQGRYESGTYYRPALWGEHSFNRQAGMATPAKLAAFIRANMPLGSGGELTAQEAWNLAAFIDGRSRPPGTAGSAGGKGKSPECPPPPQP